MVALAGQVWGLRYMDSRLVLVGLTVVSLIVTATASVDSATTLQCHIRSYKYTINKPHTTASGEVLQCYDDVTVNSCWGRCGSNEYADFKVPYKISAHPVCTYNGRRSRIVTLSQCDQRHPDPTAEVFDALECTCQKCESYSTNCENING